MREQRNGTWKRFLTMLIFLALFSPDAGAEDIMLSGAVLDDNELAEVYGGFMNPDGSFIYFSIEFFQVKGFLNNSPELAEDGTFLNVLQQRAFITEDGMGVEIDITQNGSLGGIRAEEANGNPMSQSPVNQVSFINNSGLVNANIINGNFNSASITNLIKIEINFFQVKDFSPARTLLQNLNIR
ncbi:MAG: hypothetical protein C4526_09090 [Nitrospiraceae bacterium]|nr:MAG: hypothetical protein C4526_09090 [Nitrospiraceae bacterium]